MLKNYNNTHITNLGIFLLLFINEVPAATDNNVRVIAGPDIGQVFMALAFVLVLVFILAFLTKFLPAMRYNSGQNIKVIEALAINSRDKLMIVQVNQQQLLVGLTAQGMQTLHVLSSPVTPDEQASQSFAEKLVAHMQGNNNA